MIFKEVTMCQGVPSVSWGGVVVWSGGQVIQWPHTHSMVLSQNESELMAFEWEAVSATRMAEWSRRRTWSEDREQLPVASQPLHLQTKMEAQPGWSRASHKFIKASQPVCLQRRKALLLLQMPLSLPQRRQRGIHCWKHGAKLSADFKSVRC